MYTVSTVNLNGFRILLPAERKVTPEKDMAYYL